MQQEESLLTVISNWATIATAAFAGVVTLWVSVPAIYAWLLRRFGEWPVKVTFDRNSLQWDAQLLNYSAKVAPRRWVWSPRNHPKIVSIRIQRMHESGMPLLSANDAVEMTGSPISVERPRILHRNISVNRHGLEPHMKIRFAIWVQFPPHEDREFVSEWFDVRKIPDAN